MNSLFPIASRISCLGTRSAFQKFDGLALRIAKGSVRGYSGCLVQCRRKEGRLGGSYGWDIGDQERTTTKFQVGGVRYFASGRGGVVARFEDLPADYRDGNGLAYRDIPLTRVECRALFGNNTSPQVADRWLRILHGRRVAGTLEDPTFLITDRNEKKMAQFALAWLRVNVPVDEVKCAGLRAEKELAAMESEFIDNATRIGLYAPNPKHVPNLGYENNIYGKSEIESIREKNEQAYEDELKALGKSEEEIKRIKEDDNPAGTTTLEIMTARAKLQTVSMEDNPRWKKYYERAKILPDKPPEMSAFQRLWPSGLLCLAVIAASYLFTQFYTPPRNSDRLWPDIPPSAATIMGLFAMNALVLFAWRVPPLLRFLNKYFITYPGYPHAFSMLGTTISHMQFSHFGMNMLVLWLIGVRLHDDVGRANFLAIYAICGVSGSFLSLASWVLRGVFSTSALGASTSLCGIVATYLMLHSDEKMQLWGVFPPESWPSLSGMGALAAFIVLEIIAMRSGKIATIDHWGHLGGYFSGILVALYLNDQAKRTRERESERRKNMSVIDRIKSGKF